MNGKCLSLSLFLLLIFAAAKLWAQGPPFQTDDPVPVDLHHYEFYIFGSAGRHAGGDRLDRVRPSSSTGAPFPVCSCTPYFPWGGVFPSNNPIYLPGGTGPSAFGLTDMELGVKLAFIKETKAPSPDRHLYHV